MAEQQSVMGMYGPQVPICGHGYQHPHCPINACPHHGNVTAQQLAEIGAIRQATAPLGYAQAPMRQCEHCYCMTPTLPYGTVPHRQCCNCGNRQAVPTIKQGDPSGT